MNLTRMQTQSLMGPGVDLVKIHQFEGSWCESVEQGERLS